MSKFWESPWVYRVLSLVLALGIFVYVNQERLNNTFQGSRKQDTALLATKTQTLSVPLQLNADTDKYFITGYPAKVKVKLEGSSALVTAVANTQNFRVVADLRKLSVGEHTVKLQQQGLSKQLTYSIKPKTIKVNIQTRISKTLPIQVHYNKDAIADGYQVGTPQLSSDTVQVTGARSEINRIFEISASVTLNRNTNDSVTQTVMLQALDSNGQTVNVVTTPETVRVKLPVTLPSKKVPMTFKQSGDAVSGKSYELSADNNEVTIYGSKAQLKKIDSLEVPVDISGISKTTDKTVKLNNVEKGLKSVDPSTIKVHVKVSAKSSDATVETVN